MEELELLQESLFKLKEFIDVKFELLEKKLKKLEKDFVFHKHKE